MKHRLKALLTGLLLSIPFIGNATHVIGGSLTYVYNGGSSYTVTLKLYRDCRPGTTNFPASVTITVLGYNGAAFTPSKNITMTLGTVTLVPPNIPPCGVLPPIIPCTQEGIYTTTVNNLPPNPGGYHLYYQIVNRNGTLGNIVTPLATGESYYAYIPGPTVYWGEDFALPNGTTSDGGATAWSITAGVPAPASASVNANVFQITGANNAQETWTSQVISISSYATGVNLKVDLAEAGTLDINDSVFVYYRLDGGPLTLFSTNGFRADDFTNAVASQGTLTGSTIQIVIRVHYDATSPNTEIYRLDNVLVYGNDFIPNSDPVFNKIPPLFICVGIPFTFDHSATDMDGDSLVYSFYQPYNGDTGPGPLDPTFPGNVATFTPITWLAGYSTTNPLGGTPLTLNSSTGLISGTPPTLGQFVLGVVVREYRNGVLIGQTLRDLQFNVINCPPNLAVTVNPQTPTICFGQTSTTITANGSGGTPPYTYLWNGVNPSQSINVGVGTFDITITDANGCSVSDFVTVTSFTSAITASAGADDTVCTQNPVVALNGSITAASGGIWSGGAGVFSPNTTALNATYTPTAAELSAGTVNLVLTTTGNGSCPAASDTVRVSFMGFTGTIAVTPVSVSCFGGNDGSATVTVTGGISPYTYFWSTAPAQTTQTASNLSIGTYSVTITNGIGCTNASTTVTITQPPPLTVNLTVTNVSCFGGNSGVIAASVAGGTPGYSYLWAPGGQTTASASNLTAGIYTITVTDARGCTVQSTATVAQPVAALIVSVSSAPVTCGGGGNGTASASASGGTPVYAYLWSAPIGATTASVTGLPAGTYTATVTDNNGCTAANTVTITEPPVIIITTSGVNSTCGFANGQASVTVTSGGVSPFSYIWSPSGGTSATATGLLAGAYTVVVTDATGCSVSGFVNVNDITGPTASITSVTNVTCNGGSNGTATVSVTAGTSPFTYLWSPSGGTNAIATGLIAGSYTAAVTDANGCLSLATTNPVITEPSAIAIAVTAPGMICFGASASATVAASGGTPGYIYTWLPSGNTGTTINGLPTGTYTVLVTDANSCVQSATFAINQATSLTTAIASSGDVSCYGGNNGAVTASAGGGTPAYNYNWLPYGGSSPSATGLIAGTYTVNVTDNLGCTGFATAVITEPTPVNISIGSVIPISCYGGNNGAIAVTVAGGTSPYTFLWSNAQTSASATGLSSGIYTVTATDNNSCTMSIAVNVTQPSSPLVASTSAVTNPACYAGTGSATVSASGGTVPYIYSWSTTPVQTGSTLTAGAGTYTVSTTDNNGCTASNIVTITQPTQVVTSGTDAIVCSGASATLNASASGGAGGYYFTWQTPSVINSGTLTITPAASITYTVVAYDQNGCAGTPDTVSATVYSMPPANIQLASFTPICLGQSTYVFVQASGVTGPLTYSWNNGLPAGAGPYYVTPSVPTTYIVTVTNSCGVSVTDSVQVTFNLQPAIALSSDVNSACVPAIIQFYDSSLTGNADDPITSWLWNFGDGGTSDLQNPVYSYTQPGAYSVTLTVTTDGGCTNNNASAPVIINAIASPTAGFTTSPSVVPMQQSNPAISFNNQSVGGTSYNWDFGDGGTSGAVNPSHHFPVPGTYTITLITTNQFGCMDTFRLITSGEGSITFPTAFTPNKDGPNGGGYNPFNTNNDVFFPFASNVKDFHMQIFNRWGELIFETFDIKIGWDGYYRGKLSQQDVYVWKVDVKFTDGRTLSKAGDITLLR